MVAAAGGGAIRPKELVRSYRIPARWVPWLVAIVLAPLAVSSTAFMLAGMTADHLATANLVAFAGYLAAQSLTAGVGEELGWRGWLLPTLMGRGTFAGATALTTLIWLSWHGPVYGGGVRMAISFVMLMASCGVLLAWLWRISGGSVGVVAIAHGAVNAPIMFLEQLVRPTPGGQMVVNDGFWYASLLFACLAAVVVLIGRRRLRS